MTYSRRREVVEDWRRILELAFKFPKQRFESKRKKWCRKYTYYLDRGVRQNVGDWTVSQLKEPWLSVLLEHLGRSTV